MPKDLRPYSRLPSQIGLCEIGDTGWILSTSLARGAIRYTAFTEPG